MQREGFFFGNPNFWAWADKLGPKFGGILGIFVQFISTHFGTVSPLSMALSTYLLYFFLQILINERNCYIRIFLFQAIYNKH